MVDLRFWGIPVFIAINTCSVSYICIFQIGKMLLVKIPDLFKYFFTVDCRARTGSKNLLFLFIGVDVPAFSPGKGPSQRIVIIARIIQFVSVKKLNHPGTAGKGFFVAFYG